MNKSMAGRAKEGKRDSFTLADDKDLGGLVSGGLWFGGLHLPEELLEDPHERLVVFGAEDFGDEGAAFGQELAGQLERHQRQVCLRESVVLPVRSDVRRAVVQHNIHLPRLQLLLQSLSTYDKNITLALHISL